MNQSFSSQCEAVTHDSDLRKLSFVFRDLSGNEAPIDLLQRALSMLPNPELLPIKFAVPAPNPNAPSEQLVAFTRPFEIRNRNRASFQMKFVQPPPAIIQTPEPVVTQDEPPAPVIVGVPPADNDWGLQTSGTISDTYPPFLQMPGPSAPPDATYLTRIRVSVSAAFAAVGLSYLRAEVIDPTTGEHIAVFDLMSATVQDSIINFSLPTNTQGLQWHLVAIGANIDTVTAGEFTIKLSFEDRTPLNHTFQTSDDFVGSGQPTDLSIPMPVAIPYPVATITEIRVHTVTRFTSTSGSHTFDLTIVPNGGGTPLTTTMDLTQADTVYSTSGLSFHYEPMSGNTLQLHIHSDDLTKLANGGLLMFEVYYTVPVIVPFAWSAGDTLEFLAFVSLDDKQYVPISLARHDWSNTPFVDIIKFDALNLPDDFDPGPNPVLGIGLTYPTLDQVMFRNAIMFFLTDFDDASTWNYIRFMVRWIPDAEPASTNGDVAIEITANAREL